jgi:hypothetical protein
VSVPQLLGFDKQQLKIIIANVLSHRIVSAKKEKKELVRNALFLQTT